jgi:hypothetical protein
MSVEDKKEEEHKKMLNVIAAIVEKDEKKKVVSVKMDRKEKGYSVEVTFTDGEVKTFPFYKISARVQEKMAVKSSVIVKEKEKKK